MDVIMSLWQSKLVKAIVLYVFLVLFIARSCRSAPSAPRPARRY